jgi:hypothetical protein
MYLTLVFSLETYGALASKNEKKIQRIKVFWPISTERKCLSYRLNRKPFEHGHSRPELVTRTRPGGKYFVPNLYIHCELCFFS